MLILMCGLPFSGKSTVVDLLFKDPPVAKDVVLIRPSDYFPESFADSEEEKHFRIEAWKAAMNGAEEAVEAEKPETFIVLDCGNSKFRTTRGLIRLAKRNKHRVVLLYVHALVKQCEERAGKDWVGEDVAKGYIESIKDSLPKFKSKCDRVIAVDNKSSLDDLKQSTATAWSKLCQTI